MNLGLTVTFDLDFIKEHKPLNHKMLKTLIVTKSVVGCITAIDNKLSQPFSVEYVANLERLVTT